MANHEDLIFLPELTPKKDEHLLSLLSQAFHNKIPVHFAVVPVSLIVPFDLDYRPDLHELGAKSIAAMVDELTNNKLAYPLLYPRGFWFILSDDYISLNAYIRVGVQAIGCFILGEFDHPQIKQIEVVPPDQVRRMLGME